jgi:DNA-directed RNA polymerase alpha subunit
MSKEVKNKNAFSSIDINVSKIKYVERVGHKSSLLEVELYGKDLNRKIVNALRRVACNNIPVYAFPPELIKIEENTCVAFNNDMMRLRLSLLPIYNIKNDLHFLHERFWYKVNYADPEREKHKDEKVIELHINSFNNTNTIKNVTTEDIRYYVDGQQDYSYNKYAPFLLIKLRPNDTFKCYMKAALGVGENKIYWNAASNAWFEEVENSKYKLSIKSAGQMSEYDILKKSCKFLIKKLEDLSNELDRRVNEKEINDETTVHFILDGEDHTIGELLNYEFQSRKNDIIFSGAAKLDHLIKSITIKVCSANEKSPVPVMKDCILVLIKKIQKISEQLNLLN